MVITTPFKYLISFLIIILTKFPISLGSPALDKGSPASNCLKFWTSFFNLSVLNGPGAILIHDIFFLNTGD